LLRVITSASAAVRLDAAREFLAARDPAAEAVVVSASRGAADDLARRVVRGAGATFGLSRFSLTEIAARAAAAAPDRRRVAGTQAGAEAIAARAVFDALAAGDLRYFQPVADLPGFPRALARTVHELRLGGVDAAAAGGHGTAAGDLAGLFARIAEILDESSVDDRAALFETAADACRADRVRWARLPLVLVDVPVDSRAEQRFVEALVGRSPSVLATMPLDDGFARRFFEGIGAAIETRDDAADPASDLAHLRRHVFSAGRPADRIPAGDVVLYSAPGEGREAVEIVRRVLDEARRGVPFDEMAVFLRAPGQYLGLLEHACARGDVPAYFDRGTDRPHPAGRAFMALLSSAADGLSARKFDEYLSLGQVPRVNAPAAGTNPARRPGREAGEPVVPDDEAYDAFAAEADAAGAGRDEWRDAAEREGPDSDDEAVVGGTLRSPWKWEELIVESSVVGGRTRAEGGARWRRRLDGLANDYRLRLAELLKEEPESPRVERYRRDLRNLAHLRRFALPIVDELAGWPEQANWGEWLDRFAAIAERALDRPERVLQTLAALWPMSAVGPVTLDEACAVLHDRLVTLERRPPARRYGQLFVGTPHQARGRSFRVVFVPGLAERIVPQRPREDPLLLDAVRRSLASGLVCQDDRSAAERLLLKLAIGAATERLYLSYPRLDVAETRQRVPSFYALDVMRAITGRVPDYQALAREAAAAGGATLAWPAPVLSASAIDDLEHDLATLKPLLDERDHASVKGHAHYLLGLNEALRRSVVSRYARDRKPWSAADGLVRVTPAIAPALDANRLGRRAYSLSALQRFATCPYQFVLSTIHRLEPWEEPEPLMRMDPLTRGSLFHEVQARFFRAMQAAGALPVDPARIADASRTLDDVLNTVAAEYGEQLAPAIDRVWHDEIEEIRRDLGIWVSRLAEQAPWRPEYFEFSFGLSDAGRDPRSVPDPVLVDGRFLLHGSVDLIEADPARGVLRVTDHKTGRNRAKADQIVGGGKVLQPVLYSMAVEQALGRRVERARLYFATTAGGFSEAPVTVDDYSRRQGLQVLEIVDRAVAAGFLVPAPEERACQWCDFKAVCGPRVDARLARKAPERLADLEALRSMR
jgi:ATP-dependent helicase/nuclease subunit B